MGYLVRTLGERPLKVLEQRVAVVTGAGSGIGRAIACRLAREGCHIALVDMDANGL